MPDAVLQELVQNRMFDFLFHSFLRRLSLVCLRMSTGLCEGLESFPVPLVADEGVSRLADSMGKHFSGRTNDPYLGLHAK